MLRINVFDWETEFADIMQDGGFDAVIGNPPYIRIQGLQASQPKNALNYLKKKYVSGSSGSIDIYVFFLEKALNLINKNGVSGYILPHKFFQAKMGQNIRSLIAEKKAVQKVVDFGANQIFSEASTYTCLFFMSGIPQINFSCQKHDIDTNIKEDLDKIEPFSVDSKKLNEKTWSIQNPQIQEVLDKINNHKLTLNDITKKIFVGLQTSADKIYVLSRLSYQQENSDIVLVYSKSLNKEIEIEKGIIKPFLMGKDVKKYKKTEYNNYVIFPYLVENKKAVLMTQDYIKSNFPLAWKYLLKNKTGLENREKGKMKHDKFYAYLSQKSNRV